MTEFKIIAKTFQGLEEVLAKELINLGANNVEIGRRMVAFTGNKEMLYKANFCTRTAVKVLKPIKEFKATDADEVYEVVKQIDWEQYMDVKNTFLVDSVVFSENFRHSKFVAYRVKDAIADYWRDKTGDRPNVGISNPDIRINVHIAEDLVTVSLDSSGESLHQRGYKTATVSAPINEVLAAGLIMLTGWDGECDLIDPFCGSGTILIEAALIALNVYPGVFRKEYAFEKWKDFDADLFDRIYNDDSQEREFNHKIYGYDINRQAVQISIDNVQNAGVKEVVSVEQRDFYEFEQPLDKAIIITNPPYGDRITTDDIYDLYETIGKNLKRNFVGNDAWIITHHEELFDRIGFRPSTKYALFNGSLECEFRKYQIFDGKLKDRREEGMDIKSDDERRHNLKFKPHKKNEDGEWGEDRQTDDENHYFKSKPYKDKPYKERGSKDYNYEERPKSRNERWKMLEAEDEEEAEIINRHLGKWGDRVVRPSKGGKPFDRRDSKPFDRRDSKPFDRRDGKRKDDNRGEERERYTTRESRQEARKEFFSNPNGDTKKNFGKSYNEGRKGFQEERRPHRDGERPARKFDGQKGGGRPFPGKKGDQK
ncbi:MAG: RNA methyltransferase [Bacteroidaceae bacterium]|nr:RNA methyltransferase [Bacteroidaceae bacterium]